MEKRNQHCYRAQSFQTSRLLAAKLGLATKDYTTSFQSRFGKDPWIEPYTDQVLETCKQVELNKIMVISPSFATDCLETLEEVAIGLKSDFEQGEPKRELIVEPCLNDGDAFIAFLKDLVEKTAEGNL